MAKFLCVCGHRISTSGDIPNPDQWQCLSDVDFEAFQGTVNAEELYMQTTLMYRCPVSDHLWFFWKGIDEPPVLYAPTPLPEGWH
jgi:hypothetical protein